MISNHYLSFANLVNNEARSKVKTLQDSTNLFNPRPQILTQDWRGIAISIKEKNITYKHTPWIEMLILFFLNTYYLKGRERKTKREK